jgi:response regulator NasT
MENLKILISEDDSFVSASLSAMIQNLGHKVVDCTISLRETVEKARALLPDLVMIDIRTDAVAGLDVSRQILRERPLPIVILTSHSDPQLVDQADAIGVSGYLIKPFTQKEISPAITLAWSRFKQLHDLRKEVESLREMLRSRKLIEQAKGLLMERESITEAEAFRRIQKMSRNQNIAMSRLAEAIIMTGKLMKQTDGKGKCPTQCYNQPGGD